MALFKDLTSAIADGEILSEMTVTGIGQYLRDAGLISKLGRGKAAAQMTLEDAVNLIIAVNATDMAKNAVATVEIYRKLTVGPSPINERSDKLSRFITTNGNEFGHALEVLIAALVPKGCDKSAFQKELDESISTIEIGIGRPIPSAYIKICFDGPRSPSNPFSGSDRNENVAFAHYWNERQLWSDHPGQREIRVFTKRALIRVASILA